MLKFSKDKIMQKKILTIFIAIGIVLGSCESLVDDINDNPNRITADEIDDTQLFLTGAMLANSVAQAGHLNRISGLWSGQLTGFTSLYANIYGYSISTAESVSTWSRVYIGVISNARHMRNVAPNDNLLVGISKVLEAHAIGTMASLCGDVPYSEINDDLIQDPVFDSQVSVFNNLLGLLDSAISDLNGITGRTLPQDIYFNGDAGKWVEAANTLRARYYLQLKDYGSAYSAASNGISSPEGSMKYIPRGDEAIIEGDKNLFWTILAGPRNGDIGTGNSYLMQLLDSVSVINRYNAKTDERARFGYYTIDELDAKANRGIIEQFEPHNLVTFQENLLILAETGVRTIDFDTGLGHLNEVRAYLNTGDFLNVNFVEMPFTYDAYDASDFAPGGMENADNIAADRALLREIIEERYVSGFGMFMPFNDARRLRKSDTDLLVPFPLNTTAATMQPERLPYSNDELNTNSNAPDEDPGIFIQTMVNQ